MIKTRVVAVLLGIVMLGGCSYQDWETVNSGSFEPTTSNPFSLALSKYYTELARFEGNEMNDWRDAVHYSRKALATARGEAVLPDEVASRDVGGFAGELSSARSRLMAALDGGARIEEPDLAAFAQTRFDCWLEQQEEGHQPDHIADCRAAFLEAMAELEAEPEPMPAPEPEPEAMIVIEPLLVYFDWDSSQLRPTVRDDIAEYVDVARDAGITEYSVTGHTDTSGPADYNLRLSLRRANSVKDFMVSLGVPPAAVSVAGRGESELAVPTGDGVREQANRRAEIIVQ